MEGTDVIHCALAVYRLYFNVVVVIMMDLFTEKTVLMSDINSHVAEDTQTWIQSYKNVA